MDLTVVYSKTAKGMRARSSLIGGLSSQLMKVLSHIDGASKAETILEKLEEITELKLAAALTQLETEGYIKAIEVAAANVNDWALTTNFAPMVVEDFQGTVSAEITEDVSEAQANADNQAKLQAEYKAKLKEEVRLQAEIKAQLEAQHKAEEVAASQKAELEAQAAAEQVAAEQARVKAQAEVKENARREVERLAQEAEQARKKWEAEEKAKVEVARLAAEEKAKAEAQLEAERQAKAEAAAEAEAKIKADEKERARLDIARIVREAEEARKKSEAEAREARLSAKLKEKADEEQKKAEAEAIARAELEAKLEAEYRAKAEEKARLQAEIKANQQAEQNRTYAEAKQKASEDANLKASLAMQSFVTDATDTQKNADIAPNVEEAQLVTKSQINTATSQKADIKAKLKAEQIRAKYEAGEKAQAEEREIARLEMERIGREAEIERQKQHPQASAVLPLAALEVEAIEAEAIEVQWGNPEQENDDKDFGEEERIAGEVEKVGIEIKKKTKRVAEVEGRQEIIRAAQEEAHVKAKSKVESQPLALTKHLGKWASVVRKVLLIYLPPAILLVLLLLHFINISPLVAPIEKLASESLGSPVVIEQVRASLWPRPHLVLKNITIGVDSAQKIEAINIAPVRLGLSEGVKTIKSIDIEGLKIEQENFGLALKWMAGLSKAQDFTVEQVTLHKIVLKIKDLELLPLDGEVMLTESRELKTIDLITDDETLAMQITPQGSGFDIALNGTNWALPMNQKLMFSELKATGNIKQNSILFDQIEGMIYGGSITGKAALDWSNQWSLAGNFNLSNANLSEILKASSSSASIDGKFKLTGIFSSQSKLAATLTDAPEITANFTVQNGKINGVELDRAVLSKNSQSLAGDSTRFDKLTGRVKIKNGSYHYKQLVLKSDQFYAEGNVDIQPNQDISGRVSADLAAQSRRLQDSFNLAGNVSNVKRQ